MLLQRLYEESRNIAPYVSLFFTSFRGLLRSPTLHGESRLVLPFRSMTTTCGCPRAVSRRAVATSQLRPLHARAVVPVWSEELGLGKADAYSRTLEAVSTETANEPVTCRLFFSACSGCSLPCRCPLFCLGAVAYHRSKFAFGRNI